MSKSYWKKKIEETAKRDRENMEDIKVIPKQVCSKCGKECQAIAQPRVLGQALGDCKAVSKCCSADLEYHQPEKETEWKDLDKSTPIEVISNTDKIIVQRLVKGKWKDSENSSIEIFEDIIEGWNKYRYRLKPLEPMKVDKDIAIELFNMPEDYKESWFVYRGRKVEII